jgi:hypothetical protein
MIKLSLQNSDTLVVLPTYCKEAEVAANGRFDPWTNWKSPYS